MNKPSQKSFTLIELLVVIAIIGILAGIIIVATTSAISSANDARRKADISQIVKSLLIYESSGFSYPTATTCNIGNNCPSALDDILGALKNTKDPSGNYYKYYSNGDSFIISAIYDSATYNFDSSTNTYSNIAPTIPVCGTAAKVFYATATGFGTTTFCSTGNASVTPSFPSIGETVNWSCVGNTTVSCSASRITSCVDGGGLHCSEYTDGSYTLIQYTLLGSTTGTASWIAPSGISQASILVVAGGGGGGGYGGGGGAGGVRLTEPYNITTNQSYTVTVGVGGIGGTAAVNQNGSSGANSEFKDLIAYGGGGTATDGGSGGAKAYTNVEGSTYATSGVAGQGNNSGKGNPAEGGYPTAGGGGAGGIGGSATSSVAGLGGAGRTIWGVIYGKGGDGSRANNGAITGADGINGRGDGGGSSRMSVYSGIRGGNGGSGTVIIKFLTPQ